MDCISCSQGTRNKHHLPMLLGRCCWEHFLRCWTWTFFIWIIITIVQLMDSNRCEPHTRFTVTTENYVQGSVATIRCSSPKNGLLRPQPAGFYPLAKLFPTGGHISSSPPPWGFKSCDVRRRSPVCRHLHHHMAIACCCYSRR